MDIFEANKRKQEMIKAIRAEFRPPRNDDTRLTSRGLTQVPQSLDYSILTRSAPFFSLELNSPDLEEAAGQFKQVVVGVGVSVGANEDDCKIAVRVQAGRRSSLALTRILGGFDPSKVDIKRIGPVTAANGAAQTNQPALTIGCSISHYLAGTGTASCEVQHLQTGERMVLSNNHVIGLENDAVIGDAIVFPGVDDAGGNAVIEFATFAHSESIRFDAPNYIDAAIARLNPGYSVSRASIPIQQYDPDQPIVPTPSKRTMVQKWGRTTGYTTGQVSAINVDGLVVDYGGGYAQFDNQIEVEGFSGQPFALRGDSGSLVTDSQGRAVGIVFAVAGTNIAYINPIGRVLDEMGVVLV
jgi:hypothetical protein